MMILINKNYDNNDDDNNNNNNDNNNNSNNVNIRNISYILVTFFINNILSFF